MLPKSTHANRIVENMAVFAWSLTAEQMSALGQMEDNKRYCWDSTEVL